LGERTGSQFCFPDGINQIKQDDKSKDVKEELKVILHNHISLEIEFHHVADETNKDNSRYRVVGVRAYPER
jgi:arabinogalactan endo-1,4-beta-galactosidase